MSGPATGSVRIRAQARFDAETFLRNGEQLLVSLVLPALTLLALTYSPVPDLGPGRRIDVVAPGVLALAVLSSAFTSQAIATGFDRRYGVLRLLGVTPLGRGGLLAARVIAVMAVAVLQFAVLGVVAVVLGWRPDLAGLAAFLLFWLAGTVTFVALALLMAGTLRAEATLALANLLWVLMLGVGGVVLPADRFSAPWAGIVSALPSAALGDGFRGAFAGHGVAWLPLLVLAVWGAALAAAAARWFRWSD
ncbi:MAG TPA: ABC transporter permease [Dermatophilaceae bacterium]|nr:ABC transporter permease [Dermatophilaceae bacterium]